MGSRRVTIMQRIVVFFFAAVLAVTCLTSCATSPPGGTPQRIDQGQVFVYLSCSQKSSVDITFTISGMSFMTDEGEWNDVALERRIDSAELTEQQLKLSEFFLPAGKYERMKWTVSEAKVKRAGKAFSLAVPALGEEDALDIEFVVFRGESLTLFVDWDPEASILDKYFFKPRITARKQGIEITRLLIYVTNSGSDCVTMIDRQEDLVVGTIAVGRSPMGVMTSPDRTKVYVANFGSNSISVIDKAALRVIKTIGNFGYSPAELALSGDGRWLYATNPNSDNVSVIDTVSDVVIRQISVGQRPTGIAFDPDRNKVYVANWASHSVSIIDPDTHAVEDTVTVGLNPSAVAIQEDRLYVANSGSNNISVIDIPSYVVVETIPVGQRPLWVQSGLSRRIYVANADNNEIAFIYTSMGEVTRHISVGDLPSQMGVDPVRRKLYVVNRLSEDLSVIDLIRNKVKTVIQVGGKPYGIALIKE
jgi:YVTN family beta-propeller protein